MCRPRNAFLNEQAEADGRKQAITRNYPTLLSVINYSLKVVELHTVMLENRD